MPSYFFFSSYVHSSVCLSFFYLRYRSLYLSINMSIFLGLSIICLGKHVYINVYMFVYPSICLSLNQSISLSVCLSVFPSAHQFIYLFIYLSFLSISLSISYVNLFFLESCVYYLAISLLSA